MDAFKKIYHSLPVIYITIISLIHLDYYILSTHKNTEKLSEFKTKNLSQPRGLRSTSGVNYYYKSHMGSYYNTGETFIPDLDTGNTFIVNKTGLFNVPVSILFNHIHYPVGSLSQEKFKWHMIRIVITLQIFLLFIKNKTKLLALFDILMGLSTIFTIYFCIVYLSASYG